MTLLSKIALGVGVCCAFVTPLVFPDKVSRIAGIGIGLLAYGGVNQLGTMTVEKMKKAARNTVIVGTGIGIMVRCGVKWDFIVKSAVFTGISIVIGLGLLFTVFYFVIVWCIIMACYSFSRGITPQEISANALNLCRLNREVREALGMGNSIEIEDPSLITEGIVWKICRRISSGFIRVLEFCRILHPSYISPWGGGGRRFGRCQISYGDTFVIIGALQKGRVKWLAGARGVGRWQYISLRVDVEDEDTGLVTTIQVPTPEGDITVDVPRIAAA